MKQSILNFKKYGKQNQFQKVITDLKSIREINPHLKSILKSRGLKPYIPKLNTLKLSLLCGGVLLCLLTPFTNWFIPFLIVWGLR